MKRYIIHGMVAECEFDLPNMNTTDADSIDFTIRKGEVPDHLETVLKKRITYEVNRDEFLFTVKKVGRYYVRNGNEIIVDPLPDAAESSVRLFLLGTSVGVLLHQRNMLPFHSSAIITENGAVLFAGASGAGKSTTAAAFSYHRGYSLLADDVSVLSVVDDQVVVTPGFPGQRLWADALEKLELDNDSFENVRPEMEKFNVPMGEQYYDGEPVPVRNIYILGTAAKDEMIFKPIEGLQKFSAIINLIYRQNILDDMQRQQDIMKIFMPLVQHVKLIRVARPKGENTIEAVLDMLEEDFQQ